MGGAIVIFCEGKTEKAYFEILRDRIYRIPRYVRISIEGEQGQHIALIDRVVAYRGQLMAEEGLKAEEVECWAVCDDDNMAIPYAQLAAYAEERKVNLGFSRPQFESYLVQHFEQSKETGKRALIEALERHMAEFGYEGRYNKADLRWLADVLMDHPKMVDTAILNADVRSKQSGEPFLTVQELTKRLKQLRRD